MTDIKAAVRAEIEKQMTRRDAVIRALLGRWVSECEPVIQYGPTYEVIGLAREGSNVTLVRAVEEERCPECGRHIQADPQPASGFIAYCGRRLTRVDECRMRSCGGAIE